MFIIAFVGAYTVGILLDVLLCRKVNASGLHGWRAWSAKSLLHAALLTPFIFGSKATHGIGVFPLLGVLFLETAAPRTVVVGVALSAFVVSFLCYCIGNWILRKR